MKIVAIKHKTIDNSNATKETGKIGEGGSMNKSNNISTTSRSSSTQLAPKKLILRRW